MGRVCPRPPPFHRDRAPGERDIMWIHLEATPHFVSADGRFVALFDSTWGTDIYYKVYHNSPRAIRKDRYMLSYGALPDYPYWEKLT